MCHSDFHCDLIVIAGVFLEFKPRKTKHINDMNPVEKQAYLTKLKWAHAVNSRKKLNQVLGDGKLSTF